MVNAKISVIDQEETIRILEVLDDSEAEEILALPDLVLLLNRLYEKDLIEVIDEEILLTSKGRHYKETGEEIVADCTLKIPVRPSTNFPKRLNNIVQSILKLKNSLLKRS